MAFKASDYPEIRKASEEYDVAKAEFQKLDRQLSETQTTSKEYKPLLERRNEAKAKVDYALKWYKGLVEKRKTAYEEQQQKNKYSSMLKSNKAKLKVLEDDLQRAKDKGEDTTSIQSAINKIIGSTEELEGKLDEVGKNKRPTGVPKDAKFNTVTGNWESGDQKWDTSGQAVTKITTKEVKGAKGGLHLKRLWQRPSSYMAVLMKSSRQMKNSRIFLLAQSAILHLLKTIWKKSSSSIFCRIRSGIRLTLDLSVNAVLRSVNTMHLSRNSRQMTHSTRLRLKNSIAHLPMVVDYKMS